MLASQDRICSIEIVSYDVVSYDVVNHTIECNYLISESSVQSVCLSIDS